MLRHGQSGAATTCTLHNLSINHSTKWTDISCMTINLVKQLNPQMLFLTTHCLAYHHESLLMHQTWGSAPPWLLATLDCLLPPDSNHTTFMTACHFQPLTEGRVKLYHLCIRSTSHPFTPVTIPWTEPWSPIQQHQQSVITKFISVHCCSVNVVVDCLSHGLVASMSLGLTQLLLPLSSPARILRTFVHPILANRLRISGSIFLFLSWTETSFLAPQAFCDFCFPIVFNLLHGLAHPGIHDTQALLWDHFVWLQMLADTAHRYCRCQVVNIPGCIKWLFTSRPPPISGHVLTSLSALLVCCIPLKNMSFDNSLSNDHGELQHVLTWACPLVLHLCYGLCSCLHSHLLECVSGQPQQL